MEVLLLKPQREGKPGDIVTVDRVRAAFLIEVGAAVPAGRRSIETPEKEARRQTRAAKAEPEEPKKTARAGRKKA